MKSLYGSQLSSPPNRSRYPSVHRSSHSPLFTLLVFEFCLRLKVFSRYPVLIALTPFSYLTGPTRCAMQTLPQRCL